MKTKIEDFWSDFKVFQLDMIMAHRNGQQEEFNCIFDFLLDKLGAMKKNLECIFSFDDKELTGKLILLTKGKPGLVTLGVQLIQSAPNLDNWEYFIGVGYGGNNSDLSVPYEESDIRIIPEQLWVNIYKQYKTSNKFHLEIYVETQQKGLSKSSLHAAVDNLLLMYFGDAIYYNRISRFRILKRKFKNRNFLPFYAFKDFLRYNYLT